MPLERLGPYKLESLVGRGGMGAVYIATHEATHGQAAVKLLSGHLADDATFRERFKQEIETLKRLLHPNIVQLYGHGEEDGHLYYVMELVQGRSLQNELSAGRRFEWREVVRIGIAIAQALKHAHDRGIIHRDLKPANLLIDLQDHVKLADFGIAKLYGASGMTAEGGVIGTADYMSPEQAGGQPASNRSDLYSLGSVLYALLAGRPPFARRTLVEVVAAVQNESPTPVHELAPDTPEEFERIIHELLEKNPHKRPPTALIVANRLKAMEHALSLETRVGDSRDGGGPSLPPLGDERFPAPKTQIVNHSSSPTSLLPSGPIDAEFQLAPEHTMQTGGGIRAQSSRTSLGTQSSGPFTAELANQAKLPQADAANDPATVKQPSRFTAVTEQDLRGRRELDEAPFKQWAVAGAFAVVGLAAIAAATFFATRPPSADRLYATAKAAADRGGVGELIGVESELTRFLQLYSGDPRAGEIREFADQIEQHRLQRRLEKRGNPRLPDTSISPVERAYQQAAQLANTDPETALRQFEALIAVYADSDDQPSTTQCIDLARQQITRLQPEVETAISDQQAAIRRQLDRADQLAPHDRLSAEKIWRGIILLYDAKPWARDLVGLAQSRLSSR